MKERIQEFILSTGAEKFLAPARHCRASAWCDTPHSPDGHDQRLVESALVVLTGCLEQNDELRGIFEETDF